MAERGELHHVELYVADLERSLRFWGWLLPELGYEVSKEWDEGFGFRRAGTEIVFVQAPPGGHDLDRRSAGLNHLAFHAAGTADVDRLTAEVERRGIRLLYADRHPHAGGPNHYALFCEDPDGLKVELVALPEG